MGFILIPLISTIISFNLDKFNSGSSINTVEFLNAVNLYIFWVCFIGGLVFLGIIMKTAKAAPSSITVQTDSNDILGDL